MQMDATTQSGSLTHNPFPEASSGSHLFAGAAIGALDAAARLLEAGQRFVVVARTLPSAVRLRESLSPTQMFDEAGLPIAARMDGAVELYRAHAPAPRRRALLEQHLDGRIRGLILTGDDLAEAGTLEALSSARGAIWVVQDAHCLSLESSSFLPAYRRLIDVHRQGLAAALWLLAPSASAAALEELRSLFQVAEKGVHTTALEFPASVTLTFEREPAALLDRTVLSAGLRRHLLSRTGIRGVVVARLSSGDVSGTLPAAELASVAQEVGALPVTDPGEDVEAQAEGWASLFRRPEGILLTEEPEALEILPSGTSSLFFRMVMPDSPEVVLDECLKLAARGGGQWVYFGSGESPVPEQLEIDEVERLARWIASAAGAEGRPVPIDAEALGKALELRGDRGLEAFSRALKQALSELTGAGVLAGLHPARFQLEVAESHRFARPHIDNDPRYTELSQRYEAALSRMGMLQSVKYQISARPPKDVREMSRFLGYSVGELNVLFDDLAREGIIVCRQVVSGSAGNRNFEVVGFGDEQAMLDRLPVALETIAAARSRARQGLEAVERLLAAGGDAPGVLMAELRQQLPSATQAAPSSAPRPVAPDTTRISSLVRPAAPSAVERQAANGERQAAAEAAASVRVGATAGNEAAKSPAERGERAGSSQAPRAAAESPLERLNALLEQDVTAPEIDILAELCTLARSGLTQAPRLLSRLEAFLAERPAAIRARTLQVLLLELSGEGESAAQAMLRWLEHVPGDALRDAWLPYLLAWVDYRFEREGEAVIESLPAALSQLACVLPVAEMLVPAEAAALVESTGFAGRIELGELGSMNVRLDDATFVLRRQGATPETEGELWLAIEAAGCAAIPGEVTRARIAEAYLMVAGLVDESLTRRLSRAVLAGAEAPAWMMPARRRLAMSRAYLATGEPRRALEGLEATADGTSLQGDVARTRAEAHLHLDAPLEALRTLTSAGVSSSRGEGQALWQATTGALLRTCESHAECSSCPLLESEFCPAVAGFWQFLEQNPYNEPRRALRLRVEKRGRHGLELDGVRRLNQLNDRLGGHWDEALLQRWVASISGGRPEEWLSLAQRLMDSGAAPAALQAAGRARAGSENGQLWLGLTRVYLAAGNLAGALEVAVQAETVGARAWDPATFGRELDHHLGSGWESRIEALAAELEESLAAFLGRFAEMNRARAAIQAERARLEQAFNQGPWRELRDALAAFRAVAGEAAARDPLARESQARLAERERRVQTRLEQLCASPLSTAVARAELSRLADEAEQMEQLELATKAREALAAAPPLSAPAAATGERHQAGGEAVGRGGDDRRRDARQRPARGGRDGSDDRAARDAGRKAARAGGRPEGAAREPEVTRPASVEASTSPLTDGPELLRAVKEARGDRERVHLVMSAVYELLAIEPERGIKLLRDALPLFQYRDVMDRPIAKVIRDGRPADAALPRLRRVLEKEHEGRHFTAALYELSTRENPEPWKQVLGQLKLKS